MLFCCGHFSATCQETEMQRFDISMFNVLRKEV